MKHRTLAILTVIFLLANILMGVSYVRMSHRYYQIADQKYHCSELVKLFDNLVFQINTDYVQMSGIAVKHINSEQLDLDDTPQYDRLKANYQSLNALYSRLVDQYHDNCE